MPATTASTGERDARAPVSAAPAGIASGSGRARRSTLPLGVRGIESRRTKAEGTRASGSASRDRRRSSAARPSPSPSRGTT